MYACVYAFVYLRLYVYQSVCVYCVCVYDVK